MDLRPAIVVACIVLAGCAATPAVDDRVLHASFHAGDEAVYALPVPEGDLLVHLRVVAGPDGESRIERTVQLGPESKTTVQWLDATGQLRATSDGVSTDWFDPPCGGAWFHMSSADCSGWSHDLGDAGDTRSWGPKRLAREVAPDQDDILVWGGESVSVVRQAVTVTDTLLGVQPRVYTEAQWMSDRSCFPLRFATDLFPEPTEWTLLYSRCAGVEQGVRPDGDPPVVEVPGRPGWDNQPQAACIGFMGINATSQSVKRSLTCGVYEAFNRFWLAPGQGLRVIAEWDGAAPAGMRLEADGQVVDGEAPPLTIELEGFSVPVDEVEIRLVDNAVAVDPATPDQGRAVKITLQGFTGA